LTKELTDLIRQAAAVSLRIAPVKVDISRSKSFRRLQRQRARSFASGQRNSTRYQWKWAELVASL